MTQNKIDLVQLLKEFDQTEFSLAHLGHLKYCCDAAHKIREDIKSIVPEGDEIKSIYLMLVEVCERLDAEHSFAHKHYFSVRDNFLKAIRQREASDIDDTKEDQTDK